MSKQGGSFSALEKLPINYEADQFAITQTLRKHIFSPSVLRRWKECLNQEEISYLKSCSKRRNPEVDALQEQIGVLKNKVALKQIKLEFTTELVEKIQFHEQRRSR